MFQESLNVTLNENVAGGYFLMRLETPPRVEESAIGREAKPGQFVQIRVHSGTAPLLRRPFTFYKARRRFVEILYKVVGEGTRLLSRCREGDALDAVGPLGNGFTVVPDADEHVLVAGGSGIAAMYLLARMCAKSAQTTILFGARNKDEVPFRRAVAEDFNGLGLPVQVWTDDGSLGSAGFVTLGLEKILNEAGGKRFAVYASGPAAMLKRVAEISESFKAPALVSLEGQLACGLGVCQGCVVKANSDSGPVYRRVCADGPVFNSAVFRGLWDGIH